MGRPEKMTHLGRKILSSPINARVFSAGRNVYLVGGYIRDLINRGVHSKDRDFVVSRGLRPVVDGVSKALGGTVVELRKEHIVRVARKGGITLDFSRMQGDIGSDLVKRDFTVNALAWSPETGLLDLLGGLKDLSKGVVRGISKANFTEDPLRLIRAYRFAGENAWRIDADTRRIIRGMHGQMRRPAFERITLEVFKLLNSREPSEALKEALMDGVLGEIIPLSFNRLCDNIKLISTVDAKLNTFPHINYFKEFSQGLSMLGLLRLEGLTNGADLKGVRMSFSREILKRVATANELLEEFRVLDFRDRGTVFDLLWKADEASPDLSLLSGNGGRMEEFRKFLRIKNRGLISSHEIMAITGLGSGPKLGRTIYEMKRLEFQGMIKRKSDALRHLGQLKT
jgi:tRNA nucleotidyltransferase/poly(A) polymerase